MLSDFPEFLSIPHVASNPESLQATASWIANHDSNQRPEHENIRIGNLAYGVKAMAALLGNL